MSVEIINGSRTSFGPRDTNVDIPTAVSVYGLRKQIKVPVVYDDLTSHVASDVTGISLPANSVITNVFVTPATTTFVGGTSYQLEMAEDDGSNQVDMVAAITLAEMNSGDASVTVADSLVGATELYISVTATGTFTAGRGTIVVEYIEQPAIA